MYTNVVYKVFDITIEHDILPFNIFVREEISLVQPCLIHLSFLSNFFSVK